MCGSIWQVTAVSAISPVTLQFIGKPPSHSLLFVRPPLHYLLVLLEAHEASVSPGSCACQRKANMLLPIEFIGHCSVRGCPAAVQDELEREVLDNTSPSVNPTPWSFTHSPCCFPRSTPRHLLLKSVVFLRRAAHRLSDISALTNTSHCGAA